MTKTNPTPKQEGQTIDFSIHLQSVADPIEMLDLFIKKWLPRYYGHLSDTDDNDGEYLRQAIEAYCTERERLAELRGRTNEVLRLIGLPANRVDELIESFGRKKVFKAKYSGHSLSRLFARYDHLKRQSTKEVKNDQ